MLPLDDPLWAELGHAYGRAADIPDLLRTAAAAPGPRDDPSAEPWFTLWSSLCHQGDAYSASYAAVPHLVRIACETEAPIDFSFFMLPAAIEIARHNGRGPAIPAPFASAYRSAIAGLAEAVSLHRYELWSLDMLLSAFAAQAVAKGHIAIAEAVGNLDDDWIARINGDERE